MIDLDKDIELYKSKVAFYESQNTRNGYDVTARELKYVVEILEALRSERSQSDLISRSTLKNYWENRILTDCSYISSEEILQSIDDAQAVDLMGDLISRSALKEQVKNEVCEVCFDSPDERQCSPNCKLCTFNELINNAPSAEPNTEFAK